MSIKALNSCQIKYKLIWGCLENLKNLNATNKITFEWIPGQKRIMGNDKVDTLSREESVTSYPGPEPVLGTTSSSVTIEINK